MLAHNLYYLNFAGRLMLHPCVVVRVGGGEGSDAAAPSLAPPTAPLPWRDLFLTLCEVVGRTLFSSATNFLVVAASFSCCFCTWAAMCFCAFTSAFFLRASAALSCSSFAACCCFFLYNAAVFFNFFLSSFLSFSCSSSRQNTSSQTWALRKLLGNHHIGPLSYSWRWIRSRRRLFLACFCLIESASSIASFWWWRSSFWTWSECNTLYNCSAKTFDVSFTARCYTLRNWVQLPPSPMSASFGTPSWGEGGEMNWFRTSDASRREMPTTSKLFRIFSGMKEPL
jgi:hypothetical protein